MWLAAVELLESYPIIVFHFFQVVQFCRISDVFTLNTGRHQMAGSATLCITKKS